MPGNDISSSMVRWMRGVDPSAEEAGKRADDRAEDRGDEDAYQSDGQRYAPAVQHAREQVAAQAVGPNGNHVNVRGAEQMHIRRDEAQAACIAHPCRTRRTGYRRLVSRV
jgi:hypothetical protein